MTSSRRRDVLVLALFLVATGLLARAHLARTIDVQNRGMKSVGTPAAHDLARRERLFGRDDELVLLAEPGAAGRSRGQPAPDLGAWVRALGALDGVAAVRRAPLDDASRAAAVVSLAPAPDGELVARLERIVAGARQALPPDVELRATGRPLAEAEIAGALSREQDLVVPVIVALLGALLLAVYRDPVLALGALVAALGGLLWMGGLQFLAGIPLDPISSLLPVALLAIGVATGVHLLEAYRRGIDEGRSVRAATAEAARELRRPVFLTTLTTVVGFLGLAPSPIPSVRRFAWLAALGVALTCALTLVVLPCWLRLLHRPPRAPRTGRGTFLGATALRLETAARTRPLVVVGVFLGGALALGSLAGRLRTDVDPVGVLPAEGTFRRDTARVADALGGVATLDVLLPPPHPSAGDLPGAVALRAAGVARAPGIAGLADLPRRAADGTLLVRALVTAGSGPLRAAADGLAARARELGWSAPVVTGPLLRMESDSTALVAGQRRGILATLALLFLALAVGFRSARVALLGLVPNVVPCLAVHGALELAGRPLTVATAMIGSVMLGLVVDDTIHLLHAYRRARAGGLGPPRAVHRAAREVGRAVVVTSLVLAVGFGGGLAGRLVSTREFSLLAAITILAALAADLLLLPALLVLRELRLPLVLRRRSSCDPSRITTS